MAGGRGQRPGDRAAAGDGRDHGRAAAGPGGAEAAAPERRALGEAAGCEPLVSVEEAAGNDPGCAAEPGPAPEAAADAGPVPGPEPSPGRPASLLLLSLLLLLPPLFLLVAGPALPGAGREAAWCRERAGRSRRAGCGRGMRGRCCCTRSGRGRAPRTCWPARRAGGQPAAARLLAAVSACIGLGYATTEQFKHLAAAEAGPLAGLVALPDLRTLRPALAGIADRTDPLRLQQMFAAAMLAADPVTSGVYYIDDHFVPYTGASRQARAGTTSGAGQRKAARTRT